MQTNANEANETKPQTETSPEKDSVTLKKWGYGITVALSGIFVGYAGAKERNIREDFAERTAEMATGPYVHTVVAIASGQERVIDLLGETKPYASVTLYGKVSGYLQSITVDKGDRVTKGQILATIDSPETYNEYESAKTDDANKRKIAERARVLHSKKYLSDEDLEIASAKANMADAHLAELNAKKGFSILRAPFDGVVTSRFADPGALVQNAASSQTSALPIVAVSQINRLRIAIYVDQRDAAFVHVGDKAQITIAERPGKVYEAEVTRKSGELDPKNRTMLTEIELDNSNEDIVAGSFVDVHLKVKTPSQIQIPAEALIMRVGKPTVAVIDENGILHYHDVSVGETDGQMLSIVRGLSDGDIVGLNLGNNLMDGQHVQPIRESKSI